MVSHFCARGARRLMLLSAVMSAMMPFPVDAYVLCDLPAEETEQKQSIPFELFLARDQGKVETKVIVRDPYHAKLLVTNKTSQAISVRLPDVLAARPVLAQQVPFFGQQQGGQAVFGQPSFSPNGGRSQAPQSVGGAPSSQRGFPSLANSGGNNIFNIAPEQVRTIEIKCLCLNQGKPNPRTAVPYELVPLTEVNDDPQLAEVLKSYGRGEADRQVAQAAAWHLANEMSWDKLAALTQKIAINADRPWFSTSQLQAAKQLVDAAKPQSAKNEKQVAKAPRL